MEYPEFNPIKSKPFDPVNSKPFDPMSSVSFVPITAVQQEFYPPHLQMSEVNNNSNSTSSQLYSQSTT